MKCIDVHSFGSRRLVIFFHHFHPVGQHAQQCQQCCQHCCDLRLKLSSGVSTVQVVEALMFRWGAEWEGSEGQLRNEDTLAKDDLLHDLPVIG
jgi:hypothetical protein